ncbi:MAG: cytochrome c [Acidobacteria bacterium]|nr:cytochrome c [Acidobacteriota bacterium]
MFRASRSLRVLTAIAVVSIALVSTGCRQKMADQPYYDPYEATEFFPDGLSARQPVAGTVAQGHLNEDEHLHTGKLDGQLVTTYPFEITGEVLERGRERYDIYCSPCHGRAGLGNGIVVRRGYRTPPSFLNPNLVAMPVGHYVDVMTNGFGAMPPYAAQVKPRDRWAIAAYIQALQLSQNIDIDQLPADRQTELRSKFQ